MASRRNRSLSATYLMPVIVALLAAGCAGGINRVAPADLNSMMWPEIVGLTTVNGVDIELDRQHPVTIEGDVLHGMLGGSPYQIALEEVRVLWVKSSASDIFELAVPAAAFLVFLGLAIMYWASTVGGGSL